MARIRWEIKRLREIGITPYGVLKMAAGMAVGWFALVGVCTMSDIIWGWI